MRLWEVIFIPKIDVNLLLISQLIDTKVKIDFIVNNYLLTYSFLGVIKVKQHYKIFVFKLKMTTLGLNIYSVLNNPI